MPQVFQALQNGNSNGGGSVIPRGDQEFTVRSVGLFKRAREAEEVVITQRNGTPVYVRDVAHVEKGTIPRRGFVAKNGADDVVEGIVLLRKGENAVEICKRVKSRIQELNRTALPRGVKLVEYYDRSYIVWNTLQTVLDNSVEGLLLVLAILIVFMGDLRSAFIVVITIPLAALFAFVVLHTIGSTINLLSLGAVDFGIVVDGAVVMVEGMFVRLALEEGGRVAGARARIHRPRAGPADLLRDPHHHRPERPDLHVPESRRPHLPPARHDGRPRDPGLAPARAHPRAPARGGAACAAGASKGSSGASLRVVARPIVQGLRAGYAALLEHALRARWAGLARVGRAVPRDRRHGASGIGTEFLPRLEEGNIWLTVTQPLSVSTVEAKRIERRIREIIAGTARRAGETKRNYPEVRLIVTQLGRPEDGTDPKNVNSSEMHVDLWPREGSWYQDDGGKNAPPGLARARHSGQGGQDGAPPLHEGGARRGHARAAPGASRA